MNNDICFVNVSFGERYVRTQQRLRDSILKIYPDAKLFFWTDELPPGSKPFQESLYGFKVHAVRYAEQQGYIRVVWIDTCAVLKALVEPLFDSEFIAVKDDNKLSKHCGVFPVPDYWHLVGGSLYLFDFDTWGENTFNDWEIMEREGKFGTQEFIMNEKNNGIDKCGFRMDESCMAMCIYSNGLEPHDRELYDTVIEKKHFLNEGEKWYNV